jgi:poly-gamma-glutamate synthesis protein (capsule biosynthesis protein)
MLGEHPAMVGRGVGTAILRNRGFNPFAAITSLLRQADLSLANLECALSDWPRFCLPSHRECRAPALAVETLTEVGFGALAVANNHIQQHGKSAVGETLAALSRHGIAAFGLAGEEPGTCRPLDMDIQGMAVRLLGYSLRPRQHFDHQPEYAEGTPEGIFADIEAGCAAGAIVLVSIHWGDEYVAFPSSEQVDLGRGMIDAGCTLVLGHHPHVMQGWERYGRGAIFYSLGNLVFDMPWLPECRQTFLCDCMLSSSGCEEVVIHPLVLDGNHCPQPATEAESREIMDFLDEARRELANPTGSSAAVHDDEYRRAVGAALARARSSRNLYFLKNLHRYRLDVAAELIGKFMMRRVGLLHD